MQNHKYKNKQTNKTKTNKQKSQTKKKKKPVLSLMTNIRSIKILNDQCDKFYGKK